MDIYIYNLLFKSYSFAPQRLRKTEKSAVYLPINLYYLLLHWFIPKSIINCLCLYILPKLFLPSQWTSFPPISDTVLISCGSFCTLVSLPVSLCSMIFSFVVFCTHQLVGYYTFSLSDLAFLFLFSLKLLSLLVYSLWSVARLVWYGQNIHV